MHNAHRMQWNYKLCGDTSQQRCPLNSHLCACVWQQPTELHIKHLGWSSLEILKPIDHWLLYHPEISYGWIRNVWLLLFFPSIQSSLIINQHFLPRRKEAEYNAGSQINAGGNNAGMTSVLANQTPFQWVKDVFSRASFGQKNPIPSWLGKTRATA